MPPVTGAERAQIKAFFKKWAAQHSNPEFFRLLDVARRIAGTGSLGIATDPRNYGRVDRLEPVARRRTARLCNR
jgi:hypothetical protein